VKRAIEKG